MPQYTNHLITEQSPYLLAHAHNPLDWYPWGDEAFKKAAQEDKLLFISIGYSTCHWCHVMEKESFKDEVLCKKINENYVSIKVDKEEMPHIDKKYQDIHYLLNSRAGGWPLSVIMTPKQEVIFAATYLPPYSKNGMMGFSELTDFILEKYKNSLQEVEKSVQSIKQAYANFIEHNLPPSSFDKGIVETFIQKVKQNYDKEFKGIGTAPKFPHASTFDTLIDIYRLTHSYEPLHLALESYEAMAKGGIYDQIEGGFYRYSVDGEWMIPHFEKMLYTNAELISGYAKLYNIEKNPLFKRVVIESIDALKERFTQEGVFFSASDADSKDGEGRYFTFKYDEAKKALEKEGIKANNVLEYFGITKFGNFEEGLSNPYIANEQEPKDLLHVKQILKNLRKEREYPFVDYKVLTSWNSLIINAFFEVGEYVDESYTKEALDSLESLLSKVYVNKVLYHQFVFNQELIKEGLLEDYAFLISTLLRAYQAGFNEKYLSLANLLAQETINNFYKDKKWYLSKELESLASLEDASYKSSQAVMIQNFALLSLLLESTQYNALFEEMLEESSAKIVKFSHAYPKALEAVFLKLFGTFVVKASKENLLHVKEILEELDYPYYYLKEEQRKDFQVCSLKSCFYKGESLEMLKKEIKKFLFLD